MARHPIPDIIERPAPRQDPVRYTSASDTRGKGPSPSLAANLFSSLRPSQWTKNLIILAALMFGQRLLDPLSLAYAGAAFVIFCALS
ncbi:MAG TPA: hypothetical protein VHI99_22645, partial [Vicinamibacterales bacterium]|nr:hypothetical protein [Vicinamibacterales bacterium]